jgi:hypothetical protein
MIKTILAGIILAMGAGAGAGAALAADSLVGTWKLNLATSTFSPGPAPKSQTRTYSESAQGMTVTVKTKTTSGKESTTVLTFREDGKPYLISGTTDYDTVTVTRVDALTARSTLMKAGAAVGTAERAMSKDGKTLIFEQQGTHAGGRKYDDVSVYDKQGQ